MNQTLATLLAGNGACIRLVDAGGMLRWDSNDAALVHEADRLVPLYGITPSRGHPVVYAIGELARHLGGTSTVYGEMIDRDRDPFYGPLLGGHLFESAPTAAAVAAAARAADRHPTLAQREAGNYSLGHIRIQGLDISIENAKGSKRYSKDGKHAQTMQNHYGYIRRTEGEDGDHVDCFIGPDPGSEIVFVIDQLNQAGEFDEHKCMIGWTNAADAKAAYLANYSAGWTGFGGIKALTMIGFKEWLEQQRPGPSWQPWQPWFHRGV